ncbi:2OG-Fe(II) oxygenase [Pigmentiphaga sp. YJ18]|uniref:2OG-Fe(II) oxygenase n=1 Tax=Pigmentiphaga sp. YJ18 TaxID=3134907 RepID=UPI003115F0F3
MHASTTAIDRLDWAGIAERLDQDGHALLPGLLDPEAARDLARRTAATRAAPAFGKPGHGEWFHFGMPLPAPWAEWRVTFYPHLAIIANRWNALLGNDDRYPADLDALLQRDRRAGQDWPQSYLSRLRAGEHVPLHQRGEGEHVFPLQVVALLSEAGRDFQGGEFVMTERRPRMQSRPMVLPLGLGDAAVIATAARPSKGSGGHYRVHLTHGISRVHQGERMGMELSFHDMR